MSVEVKTDSGHAPKGSLKFNIQLNDEQKEAKSSIIDNVITVVAGAAGSGKTLVAVQTALDLLYKKKIKKIIITRPLVTAGEEMGFLPGGIKEKTDPYLRPIYDMISTVHTSSKAEKMIADKTIEILPFGFMRGMNLDDCLVIADEAQNCTVPQLKLLMTRLTSHSKLVICGDTDQVDLKKSVETGFSILPKLVGIEGFNYIELKHNHRHPIVKLILNALEV